MDLLPNIQVDLLQEDPEPLEEEIMSDGEGEPEPEKEEIIPEVQEKTIIPEEDIFVEKKPKKKPEPKKEPKKKRVMTEEQLERLRKGREKALEVRRAKAKEKKELKELQSKKKKKDIQKLRDEVEDKPKPEPTPAQKKVLSLEDLPSDMLVELQKRAIEGYDTKRKARKEQKKKEQQHQNNINHNLGMVNNALKPQRPVQYGEAGYFRDCF
jgi:hypothetical protein